MRQTLKEITSNMDMVIFNQCIEVDPELIYNIEAGNLYGGESIKEIYQYFIINRFDWEYLARKTDMPLFYSELMDVFIIWIDFLDNWENVSFET